MATLALIDYTEGFEFDPFASFREDYVRETKVLNKLIQKSNKTPKKKIAGRIIGIDVAEGAAHEIAYYMVKKESPLTLQYISYGELWEVPPTRMEKLKKKDILVLVVKEQITIQKESS